MNKILAGMVSPEKPDVMDSQWATIDGDTIVITHRTLHVSRVHDLKLQGYEVVDIDTEIVRNFIKRTL